MFSSIIYIFVLFIFIFLTLLLTINWFATFCFDSSHNITLFGPNLRFSSVPTNAKIFVLFNISTIPIPPFISLLPTHLNGYELNTLNPLFVPTQNNELSGLKDK